MKLKTTVVPIILLALPILDTATALCETVSFAYDNAGNRVSREIVLVPKSTPAMRQSRQSESYSELLDERTVKISTNPVEGSVSVEISGYADSDVCSLQVFSLDGRHILTSIPGSSLTYIDMSSCEAGIYILLIHINGNESSWKIIKN